MKYLFIAVFFFSLACTPKNQNLLIEKRFADSTEIVATIKNMYKWEYQIELKHLYLDNFNLALKDSIISGIDFDSIEMKCQFLKNSNFFSNDFITGYRKIAESIHRAYQEDSMKYHYNDGVPPYGPYDASLFCACQDAPDTPYVHLFFEDLNVMNDTANIKWGWKNWETKTGYLVKLKHENKKWLITNLEGFDKELKNYPVVHVR